jgi:hypothetical protein
MGQLVWLHPSQRKMEAEHKLVFLDTSEGAEESSRKQQAHDQRADATALLACLTQA